MPFGKKKRISSSSPSYAAYCGPASTGDPRVFGPNIWKSLHIMAQNYPTNPNQATIAHCEAFLNGLPYMLPCTDCGFHLEEFIQSYRIMYPIIGTDREALVKFFVEAHNNVSEHTNPGRLPWTVQQAKATYSSENVCFHNRVWGEKSLCRDTSCDNSIRYNSNGYAFHSS